MNTIETKLMGPKWLNEGNIKIQLPACDKISSIARYALCTMSILALTLSMDAMTSVQLISCMALLLLARKMTAIYLVYKSYHVGKSLSPFNPNVIMEHKAHQIDLMTRKGYRIYERYLDYSGVNYSIVIIMHSDNLHNKKWCLHSLGAGWEWENLIEYYGEKNHSYGCNSLLVNGPGVSLSGGWPTREHILGSVKAGLYFLENIAEASHIVLHGSCLGAAIASEAMFTHDFRTLKNRNIKYLVVSHVAFSHVTKFIASIAPKFYQPLIYFSGVEFDGVAAAQMLSQKGIRQIVIQHTSKDGRGTDGLVKDEVSLAVHLRRGNMPHKTYLESEELVHNRSIPDELEENLLREIRCFLNGARPNASIELAVIHPNAHEAREYFRKKLELISPSNLPPIVPPNYSIHEQYPHLLLKRQKNGKEKYKKYALYAFGGIGCVAFTDPSAIRAILSVHRFSSDYFKMSQFFMGISDLTGNENHLTAPELLHQKLVRLLGPVMSYGRVKARTGELIVLAQEFVEECARDGSDGLISISERVNLYVISIFLKLYFKSDRAPQQFQDIIRGLILKSFIGAIPNDCPLLHELHQLLLPIKEESLLSDLMKCRDDQGAPTFTESEILSFGKMLLFSGTDTTSSLLSYLIHMLGQREDLQLSLQERYQHSEGPEDFIYNDKLLDGVVQEGLRLNPSVSYISRKAKFDLIVDDRYFVPKGWDIIGSTLWLNREPSRWGENAAEFDPNHCDNQRPEFVFGWGKHLCFGRHLAILSTKVLLTLMISKFSWKSENSALSQTGELMIQLSGDVLISVNRIYLGSCPESPKASTV